MIKAVIFDMDGTMVDTENLWKEVNSELAAKYNGTFDKTIQTTMTGRKEDEALQLFADYFQLNVPIQTLQKDRQIMLLSNLDKININKGLFELLELLDNNQIRKAIATSTFEDFAFAVLDKFNLKDRFEYILTGDKIINGKPHPEMYLKVSKYLKVDPKNCLVIEDAQNGVESAHNAHMKVIAVPHEQTEHHDFSDADKIVSSLKEIDDTMLKSFA